MRRLVQSSAYGELREDIFSHLDNTRPHSVAELEKAADSDTLADLKDVLPPRLLGAMSSIAMIDAGLNVAFDTDRRIESLTARDFN